MQGFYLHSLLLHQGRVYPLLQLFCCNLGVCDGENNATSCFRACADDALPLCPNSTVASDVFTPKEPSKRTGVGLQFIQQVSRIYNI